jgi:mannan endo-1,4-beta-mannosidase
MKIKIISTLIVLLILFIAIGCSSTSFVNFISTDKDKLMDGDKELRFVSFNTPNLHYIEDYLAFNASSPWRLPDEFEIRDALVTIKELAGKVTRTYVLSVRKQDESKKIIRHVLAPGIFNEDAFKSLDKVMQVANEVGVRIIIPLVDNWWWWGGPTEYAAFRNKSKDEFWTDPQLISDFKKTIEFIVNRKNTFTGVLYKDDKALFGWETGNELQCPYSWTTEIAAYIKSLDQNHVVIEGTHSPIISMEALNDPNIDVLSSHHYSPVDQTIKSILKNRELSKDRKPYFVGEFGLTALENIKAIVDSTINNDVSGIMIWSLRFHNRDGGFYMHRENNGNGPFRFPGFDSGQDYNEREILDFMRTRAFETDNAQIPKLNIPVAPTLLNIKDNYNISWQGSVGASSYILQRKEAGKDNWITLSDKIVDADAAYKPLFSDESVEVGKEYFYRVFAQNESGKSESSNEVGPVKISFYRIVDELENFRKIFSYDGIVEQIEFKEIYQVKEDNSRLAIDAGSSIIYEVPNSVTAFKIFAFARTSVCGIQLFTVDSFDSLTEISAKVESFPPFRNVYGFLIPFNLTCEEFPANTKYIKIFFHKESQLGKIEIDYSSK